MDNGNYLEEEWRIIGRIKNQNDLDIFRQHYGQLTVSPVVRRSKTRSDAPSDTIFKQESIFIDKTVLNPLKQLLMIAETVEGEEILELIAGAIGNPEVHWFGEILELPKIKQMENGPHHVYWNTLNLFAYGTYKQYLANTDKYLDLTATQKKKLQHLTIVTLAEKKRYIPYSDLLEELDVANVRGLEDLIIETVYAELIQGKLDQTNSLFEVDCVLSGRDVTPRDTESLVQKLTTLRKSCESVSTYIEELIVKANAQKREATERKRRNRCA